MSASKHSISENLNAFLDTITFSELGAGLITPETDYGYKVIVGSTPKHPILMPTYADHPRKVMEARPGIYSTAAGAYQILARYFDAYKAQLSLPDFSPVSQDRIAIQLIRECHALSWVEAGYIARLSTRARPGGLHCRAIRATNAEHTAREPIISRGCYPFTGHSAERLWLNGRPNGHRQLSDGGDRRPQYRDRHLPCPGRDSSAGASREGAAGFDQGTTGQS